MSQGFSWMAALL